MSNRSVLKGGFGVQSILALSVFSPALIPPLSLFQIVIWPVFTVLLVLILLRGKVPASPLFISINLFTFSVLVSLATSATSEASASVSVLPAIGGVESYLQIYCAWIFAAFTFKRVSYVATQKFVVIFIGSVSAFAIALFLMAPNYAMQQINTYSFGFAQTGQWRFSSFFGLPYYAGAAYSVLIFMLLEFHQTPGASRLQRLYLLLIFIILMIGGIFTASKTFFAGVFVVFLYFLLNSATSVMKKLVSAFSLFLGLIVIYTFALGTNFDLSSLSKILELAFFNLQNPIEAVYFRYSGENSAVNELFQDRSWDTTFGIGLNASQVPTDSQWRDLLYRFGTLGTLLFAFFIARVVWLSDGSNRIIVLILLIGSLGSNTLTPINFTFLIWYMMFISIFQRKRTVNGGKNTMHETSYTIPLRGLR